MSIGQEKAAEASWLRHTDQALALAALANRPALALLPGGGDDMRAPSSAHPARRGLSPSDPDWRPR